MEEWEEEKLEEHPTVILGLDMSITSPGIVRAR